VRYTQHPLVKAMRPVADAIGAHIVSPTKLEPSDIPLLWEGEVIAGVRIGDLQGALERLVRSVERELGGPLGQLSRKEKQAAVRMLDERGAFLLRGAVEDVAAMMGVSRITIYNYLNAINASTDRDVTVVR
jgi:hypothetical protein